MYSQHYTLSYPCSAHNFSWPATPNFLINHRAWALHQANTLTHTHIHLHVILVSQTPQITKADTHTYDRWGSVSERCCVCHVWQIYNLVQGCETRHVGVFVRHVGVRNVCDVLCEVICCTTSSFRGSLHTWCSGCSCTQIMNTFKRNRLEGLGCKCHKFSLKIWLLQDLWYYIIYKCFF